MTFAVFRALEPLEDVERHRVACGGSRTRGAVGTLPAAAKEQQRCLRIVGSGLQLIEKSRIPRAGRIRSPFDQDASRHAADIVPLGARADIDQPRIREGFQNRLSLSGQDRTIVGQVVFGSTPLRCSKRRVARGCHRSLGVRGPVSDSVPQADPVVEGSMELELEAFPPLTNSIRQAMCGAEPLLHYRAASTRSTAPCWCGYIAGLARKGPDCPCQPGKVMA
jgi:hypothetical protein